ncbi:MAG: threonine synthase [Anaerolineae bacterium]|nr:threonine synthase [Anaerolineae bacterium]NUQ05269.1 threonine synthase [Anaerolineae bacterium]
MAAALSLKCAVCGREYAPDAVAYTCPACGPVGTLEVLYDYTALAAHLDRDRLAASRVASMWRYRDLLPLPEDADVPPLRVGMTPLYDAPRLAADLGVGAAWVKDDGANPTGSLKDRASALVVARATAMGISTVATASTGNAAAALAGVAASVGMPVVILVPAAAPEAKIAQLLIYGARVVLVEGTYDQAFDLCVDLCERTGWYCRNTGMNPYTAEGKKTVAYEIAEGLGWDVPDVVIVSVGDGNIIAGVHKGFADLHRLGWISRIPRLIGVQAEGSSALARAWQDGTDARSMGPEPAETLADSISAGLPRDRAKALRAVRQTDGAFVAVPDSAILAAIPALARLTGVFAEPAAAAVYAGARRAVEYGFVKPDERVLLLSTGSGLKDVRRAQQAVTGGLRSAADLDSVWQALGSPKAN